MTSAQSDIPPLTLPIQLAAPAKINLCLRITGRREDGYHNLQTAFQIIDLADELTFEHAQEISVVGLADVVEDDNLIYRAAKLLVPYAKTDAHIKITVSKRIPMGAGLGGGSSDAATTLVALNQIWQCQLSVEALSRLGSSLGADVPVFIHGVSAWGEGIGEALTPLELPAQTYLLLYPNCHVSTQAVFSHPDLTRDSSTITIARFLSLGARNDCEKIVVKLYPEVAAALAWLQQREWLSQRGPAKMTGTGSSVFLPCDPDSAKIIQAEVPQGWQSFIVEGVNQSKLLFDLGLEGNTKKVEQ